MQNIIGRNLLRFVALAAFLIPGAVFAQQYDLDSGTPTGSSFPILSNSQWFAAEFLANAGDTVSLLSAYLTSQSGNGNTFAFDIYTDASGAFLNTRNASLSSLLELSATGTYTAAGWTSTSVNWVVPATGDYWLAIQGNTAGSRSLPTFDAQQESAANTGTVPALQFALDAGTQYKTAGAPPIGLQVAVAAVPEPASVASIILGAGMLGLCVRRGKAAAAR